MHRCGSGSWGEGTGGTALLQLSAVRADATPCTHVLTCAPHALCSGVRVTSLLFLRLLSCTVFWDHLSYRKLPGREKKASFSLWGELLASSPSPFSAPSIWGGGRRESTPLPHTTVLSVFVGLFTPEMTQGSTEGAVLVTGASHLTRCCAQPLRQIPGSPIEWGPNLHLL